MSAVSTPKLRQAYFDLERQTHKSYYGTLLDRAATGDVRLIGMSRRTYDNRRKSWLMAISWIE